MSEQNIIPSAPPLYPSLGESVGDYRLKKISDCQKELENEISHYRRISKKYKRAKTIINAFAATTGVLTAVLSTASFATFVSGIGAINRSPNCRNCCCDGIIFNYRWCQQRKTQFKSHETRENRFSG